MYKADMRMWIPNSDNVTLSLPSGRDLRGADEKRMWVAILERRVAADKARRQAVARLMTDLRGDVKLVTQLVESHDYHN